MQKTIVTDASNEMIVQNGDVLMGNDSDDEAEEAGAGEEDIEEEAGGFEYERRGIGNPAPKSRCKTRKVLPSDLFDLMGDPLCLPTHTVFWDNAGKGPSYSVGPIHSGLSWAKRNIEDNGVNVVEGLRVDAAGKFKFSFDFLAKLTSIVGRKDGDLKPLFCHLVEARTSVRTIMDQMDMPLGTAPVDELQSDSGKLVIDMKRATMQTFLISVLSAASSQRGEDGAFVQAFKWAIQAFIFPRLQTHLIDTRAKTPYQILFQSMQKIPSHLFTIRFTPEATALAAARADLKGILEDFPSEFLENSVAAAEKQRALAENIVALVKAGSSESKVMETLKGEIQEIIPGCTNLVDLIGNARHYAVQLIEDRRPKRKAAIVENLKPSLHNRTMLMMEANLSYAKTALKKGSLIFSPVKITMVYDINPLAVEASTRPLRFANKCITLKFTEDDINLVHDRRRALEGVMEKMATEILTSSRLTYEEGKTGSFTKEVEPVKGYIVDAVKTALDRAEFSPEILNRIAQLDIDTERTVYITIEVAEENLPKSDVFWDALETQKLSTEQLKGVLQEVVGKVQQVISLNFNTCIFYLKYATEEQLKEYSVLGMKESGLHANVLGPLAIAIISCFLNVAQCPFRIENPKKSWLTHVTCAPPARMTITEGEVIDIDKLPGPAPAAPPARMTITEGEVIDIDKLPGSAPAAPPAPAAEVTIQVEEPAPAAPPVLAAPAAEAAEVTIQVEKLAVATTETGGGAAPEVSSMTAADAIPEVGDKRHAEPAASAGTVKKPRTEKLGDLLFPRLLGVMAKFIVDEKLTAEIPLEKDGTLHKDGTLCKKIKNMTTLGSKDIQSSLSQLAPQSTLYIQENLDYMNAIKGKTMPEYLQGYLVKYFIDKVPSHLIDELREFSTQATPLNPNHYIAKVILMYTIAEACAQNYNFNKDYVTPQRFIKANIETNTRAMMTKTYPPPAPADGGGAAAPA